MTAHRNQMERWLAAEPILPTADVQTTITLRADQGMFLALNRLICQVGTVQSLAGGQPTPTGGDFSWAAQIDSILVKGATQLIRGQGRPLTTMSTWSALRQYNAINLLSQTNPWLRLEANETIAIQFTLMSPGFGAPDQETIAHAAVPVVLDCDKGKPAYSGFSQQDGAAVLGSPLSAVAAGVGGNPQQLNPDLTWQEAGILDLSNVAITVYNDSTIGGDGNVPVSGYSVSGISSLLTIDRSEMIVGTPDTAGNAIEVPLSAYTVPSYGSTRAAPWARLPSQTGTNGNTCILDVQARVQGSAGNPAYNSSSSAPFYPASGGPLKDCP